MKIVWISHTAETSGAELSLLEASIGLKQRKCDVHIIVPWQGNLLSRLDENDIKYSVAPYLFWTHSKQSKYSYLKRTKHFIGHIIAAKKLLVLLRKIKPDIVVTNTITIPVGALAAKWAGIPHVWYIHEFGEEDHNIEFQYGKSFSLWFMNRFSDKLVVNSQAVMSKFRKYISVEKLRLVYYAVQIPICFSPQHQEDGSLHLVLVGRIIFGKRQEDAVRSLSLLKNKGIKVNLTFVGGEDREYGNFLRGLIRDLYVQDMVTFVPFTPDPFSYVASSDVALICSINEAFGRVTVEAMKLGKPVIGAKSGGTTELIRDGWNGFLFRPGDSEELAEKIEIFYKDRQKIIEFGSNAKNWANKQFNLQKYIVDLTNVFEEAIENRC